MNKPSRRAALFALVMLMLLGVSQGVWRWQSAPVRTALAPPAVTVPQAGP